MTQTTFSKVVITCLTCITLALIGIIFYLSTSAKQPSFAPETEEVQNANKPSTNQSTGQDISNNSNDQLQVAKTRPRINLGSANMPLSYSFELPIGYKAYIEEGQEGGYGARISILKEETQDVFKNSGIQLWITGESPYNEQGTGGDAVIEKIVKNHGPYITRTTFLGNKAVEVQSEMTEGHFQTIGFMKNDLVPNYPYIVVATFAPEFINNEAIPVSEYRNILNTLKINVNSGY